MADRIRKPAAESKGGSARNRLKEDGAQTCLPPSAVGACLPLRRGRADGTSERHHHLVGGDSLPEHEDAVFMNRRMRTRMSGGGGGGD